MRWSSLAVLSFVLAVVSAGSLSSPTLAQGKEARIYVRTIPNAATWDHYSRALRSDRFGKFIIDIKTDEVYYFDVNLYKLHADFVLGVLLKKPWTFDNVTEYNKNYERNKPRFILGYVSHHREIDRWTFSFWAGDKIDAAGIARTRALLKKTFFVKDLAFRPDSPAQLEVAKQVRRRGIPILTNDRIYKSAPFQAFNNGSAIGKLRVVPPGTPYESLLFERNDIVILQESYPDISPVAGILSTVFSTPLAHVNLRDTSWGIPNAGYINAFEQYGRLDGKMVYFEVGDTSHVLRRATDKEIAQHKVAQQRSVTLPKADLNNANMPMLTHIRTSDVASFGAKTSNLGEIATARLPGVHVPAGFGVPFFYYMRHMRQHGLDKRLAALLADERFTSDAPWRKAELETLRQAIQDAPIDPAVLTALHKRVKLKLAGKGVFVRSSTNAEDLDGFNGAGLYTSVGVDVDER
ncbi:MAG: PEP/pyruvate-binding domain-containing protein, partial [Myxococcota bacterium]